MAAAAREDARWLRAAETAILDGVGESGYGRIARFVCALPVASPLNVNTSPPEVLAAVVSGLEGETLAALLADRARKPFASVADFRSRLPSGASVASDAGLGVRSDFFLVTVRARQGATLALGRALLRRRGRDLPDVVWQVVE
jgi:general secretion pathway protein K